ncbi:hypothetical protein H310_02755 [Aphanomyces invadans]|uniref:Coiled-coil domain-containing protein 130 n=1 Tax=Aphanomyces invadans TaxID=157072 RepID=A0A024UJQ2_9STRA|nr:hypothetical protein H310_02755 [Aphanomyces invadans]ETW06524.1 hypothetical protein H310_02755 [Aphanomyces invadans]RHY29953.1 hypothetical protein DYB32_004738 [Aphanomyces invadans]|eukprot:XP_008864599.1 hypothetical protein H310_02755 [Aphanomyces invadans]
MSSLAAARADNFYFPPEWRPEMGGINKFQKSHPLGKRAKDIKDGILVVRFEMPFDVWCTHCNTHIGRGVRYNAKKTKVGMYHSTILYEFALTCATCKGIMKVQTDPEARGYKLLDGIKKKTQMEDVAWGTHDDETLERLNAPEVGIAMAADPFFKLEHEEQDKRVAKKRSSGLMDLIDRQEALFSDPYKTNASLRKTFRAEKKDLKRKVDAAEARHLSIPLVDVHPSDVIASKSVLFHNLTKRSQKPSTAPAISASHARHKKPRLSTSSFSQFGDSVKDGSKAPPVAVVAKRRRK